MTPANVVVSTIVAVAASLCIDTRPVLYAFAAWAMLAGLLQLATDVRRWKGVAAQRPVILSGARSGFAGLRLIQRGLAGTVPAAEQVAPYAASGALYFAMCADVLAASTMRARSAPPATR